MVVYVIRYILPQLWHFVRRSLMMKLMATTIPPVLNKLYGAFRGIFFTRKVLIFLFVHKHKCVCVCLCVHVCGRVGGGGDGAGAVFIINISLRCSCIFSLRNKKKNIRYILLPRAMYLEMIIGSIKMCSVHS